MKTDSTKIPDGPFIITRENDDYAFYPKNHDTNLPRPIYLVSGHARDKIQLYGQNNGVNITTIDILTAIQERGTFDGWTYIDLADKLVEKLKPKASDIITECGIILKEINAAKDRIREAERLIGLAAVEIGAKVHTIENKLKALAK